MSLPMNMSTNTPDHISSLVEQWTREQIELASKAKFLDDNLSFTARCAQGANAKPVSLGETYDYDTPNVNLYDPKGVVVEGLKYVGGLDISFVGNDSTEDPKDDNANAASNPERVESDAYATLVVMEFPSFEPLHTITHPLRLTTPYIPSFLSYRESPSHLALLNDLRERLRKDGKENEFPQVILVDGNGRLHVRQAGVATAVGVMGDVPTIGVAKTYHPPLATSLSDPEASRDEHWRLSQKGMRDACRKYLAQGGQWLGIFGANSASKEYVGAALVTPNSKTPIFVSAGHRVSLQTALHVVIALSKYRIPEPIRLADKISRKASGFETSW